MSSVAEIKLGGEAGGRWKVRLHLQIAILLDHPNNLWGDQGWHC